MTNLQQIINNVNADFSTNENLERAMEKYSYEECIGVQWAEKEPLFYVSNRKEQVCQMFRLGLSKSETHYVMAATKGYAVSVILETIGLQFDVDTSITSEVDTAVDEVVETVVDTTEQDALVAELKAAINELKTKVRIETKIGLRLTQEVKRLETKVDERDSVIRGLVADLRTSVTSQIVASKASVVAKAAVQNAVKVAMKLYR